MYINLISFFVSLLQKRVYTYVMPQHIHGKGTHSPVKPTNEGPVTCLHTNTYAVDRFYLKLARVQFGIAEN